MGYNHPNRKHVSWIPILIEILGDCVVCGMPAEEIDHVLPLAEGGRHILGNIQPMCSACHLAKTKADCRRMMLKNHLVSRIRPVKATQIGLNGRQTDENSPGRTETRNSEKNWSKGK